jgi:uncharacterized NAD(P)/FAD-binding protein YdhS
MKTIAIVGGGFSGTLSAVNIARLANESIRVVVVNARHPLGRGIAYGTRRTEHVLNVAARNMSAFPDHPDHFLSWLRTRVDYSDIPDPQLREMFVPRPVYGDYVGSLLFSYLQPVDEHHPARMECIEDEVVDIALGVDGRAEIELKTGDSIAADRVLLATGNQPPSPLPGSESLSDNPGYFGNPWRDWSDRLPSTQDIVVLGTGLSMVDVFLTLTEKDWSGRVICVSRNGKLPQSHFRGIEYPDFLPEKPEDLGLDGMVELLETHCAQLLRLGANPGIVVDRLRPHTQRIWQKFSLEEKKRFTRDYAAKWNVIRHRIAQPIHQRLTEAVTDGKVEVERGSVGGLAPGGNGRIAIQLRAADGVTRTLDSGMVINCTGPRTGFSDSDIPLYRKLLAKGLVRPDEMDMGIDVGPDFAVVGADGKSSNLIFAMGPLMRGTLWESIAVPELRGQAKRVAEILANDEIGGDHDLRMSVAEEHVVEYYI